MTKTICGLCDLTINKSDAGAHYETHFANPIHDPLAGTFDGIAERNARAEMYKTHSANPASDRLTIGSATRFQDLEVENKRLKDELNEAKENWEHFADLHKEAQNITIPALRKMLESLRDTANGNGHFGTSEWITKQLQALKDSGQ